MNAHTSFLDAIASSAFRARPKGTEVPNKIQPREMVVGKLPALLVSGFGVTSMAADQIASQVYDGYVANFGTAPANVEYIAKALRSPKGREALAKLVANCPKPVLPVMAPVAKQTPVAVAVRQSPQANTLLAADVEAMLHDRLMAAVQGGDEMALDATLAELAGTCRAAGQEYFVTQFANWTRVSALLIGRVLAMKLTFGLYWTEGGVGSEVLRTVKVPTAEARLSPEELDSLTAVLRTAVRDSSYAAIDRALRQIVETCTSRGVTMFVTPYANFTQTSGLLIARLRKLEVKFALYWTDGGPDGEPLSVAPVLPAKEKPSRAELAARKAANRAERLREQTQKGPTASKHEKSGKKDKKGK